MAQFQPFRQAQLWGLEQEENQLPQNPFQGGGARPHTTPGSGTGGSPSPRDSALQGFDWGGLIRSNPRDGGGLGRWDVTRADQAGQLGDLSRVLPEGRPLRIGDIPLLEANLNFQQRGMALEDRERGIDELRSAIAESPEMLAESRGIALELARSGGDLSRILSGRRTAGLEEISRAREALEQDFARRGIGGSAPALAAGELEQQGRIGLNRELGDLELSVLSQRGQAAQTLGALDSASAERLAGLRQAIANALLETEYAPIDLSGLLTPPAAGGRPLGMTG